MGYFFSALLFGLAFVVLPFGASWYEAPKVVVALLTIAILSMYTFWNKVKFHRSHVLLLGLTLLSVIGLVTSWSPVLFFGNAYRLQGVLTLWALMAWAVTSSQSTRFKKESIISFVALIVMTIIALFGRLDASGRAVGSVGEANSLGAYVLFLLPLTGSLWAGIPAILTLIIAGSRSSLIGLIASLLTIIGSKRLSLSSETVMATAILILSLLLPFGDRSQAFETRSDIWRTALVAGTQKPLFGWGVGNTEIALKSAAQDTQTFIRYQYVDSSHNVFLDWWVQGGVVGLSLFAGILIVTVRNLVMRNERVLLASFFGILAVMLFNPVSIAVLVPFWWIIGQGMRS